VGAWKLRASWDVEPQFEYCCRCVRRVKTLKRRSVEALQRYGL
jgi:hypothetical protein